MSVHAQIQAFLERYGTALSEGDVQAVARHWEVPALVVHDDGVRAVSSPAEIETFFAGATEHYHQHGMESTRPELLKLDVLSSRMVSVDVLWHALDHAGASKSSERSRYVLRVDDEGEPRIRVAVILPV